MTEPIRLPGGFVVSGADPQTADLLRKRGAFAAEYCQTKGWNIENLTIPQLLEIRSQQGWKEPK